jgi:cytochrome P450
LWASQGNAAPAVFWSIGLLASDKEARTALFEEVERVLSDRPISELATAIKESPKLDSFVSEVLRLYSSSQSIRVATEDGEITSTDGTVFKYKIGNFAHLKKLINRRYNYAAIYRSALR